MYKYIHRTRDDGHLTINYLPLGRGAGHPSPRGCRLITPPRVIASPNHAHLIVGEHTNPEDADPDTLAKRMTPNPSSPPTPLKLAPSPNKTTLPTVVKEHGTPDIQAFNAKLDELFQHVVGDEGKQSAEETKSLLVSGSLAEVGISALRKAQDLARAAARAKNADSRKSAAVKCVERMRGLEGQPQLTTGTIPQRASEYLAQAGTMDSQDQLSLVIEQATSAITQPAAKLDPNAFQKHFTATMSNLDRAVEKAMEQGDSEGALYLLRQYNDLHDAWVNRFRPIADACGYSAAMHLYANSLVSEMAKGKHMSPMDFVAKLATDDTFAAAVTQILETRAAKNKQADKAKDNKATGTNKQSRESGEAGGKRKFCQLCKATGHLADACWDYGFGNPPANHKPKAARQQRKDESAPKGKSS